MPEAHPRSHAASPSDCDGSARPWFDLLRSHTGYKFPRLGPLFFRMFYYLAPKRCTVELFPDVMIDADFSDLTYKATYWQGTRFEYPTAQVLCEWAADPRCKVFFDIGANYGFFSYLLLSRFVLQVHAFDPNPCNHRRLVAAQSRNSMTRLHPHHIGLSNEEGTLPLHLGIEDQGHSSFLVNPALGNTEVSNCSVARFDDWVNGEQQLSPVTGSAGWIAKIDVEGYELKVLQGMQESLRRRRFLGLVVELNPTTLSLAGTCPDEVCGFLRGCGYISYQEFPECRKWPLHRSPNGFFVPADRANL